MDGGADEGSHGGQLGYEEHNVVIVQSQVLFDESHHPVFYKMHNKGGSSLEGAVVCEAVPLADQHYWQGVGDAVGIEPGIVLIKPREVFFFTCLVQPCDAVYWHVARPLLDVWDQLGVAH